VAENSWAFGEPRYFRSIEDVQRLGAVLARNTQGRIEGDAADG